jgi:hypothetical protein
MISLTVPTLALVSASSLDRYREHRDTASDLGIGEREQEEDCRERLLDRQSPLSIQNQ